ncbi:MAG: diphthine synthase [Candidatus Poseidoniales archaeon]
MPKPEASHPWLAKYCLQWAVCLLGTLKWRMILADAKGAEGLSMTAGLILIGLGPGGISGMTRAAIKAATQADIRLYEAYTALWSESDLTQLEAEIGEITKVMRPAVEAPQKILDLAKTNSVAILVVGDPLQATTHVDLQLQAEEGGVDCEVIHGLSITGLVTGAIGLSNYKFGRQTTLTYPYGGWIATSPLEVISLNRIQGLHTLCLLDLDPTGSGTGDQRPMQPKDAQSAIMAMAKKLEGSIGVGEHNSNLERLKFEASMNICREIADLEVILCTDMGGPNQSILFTNLTDLHLGPEGGLHCIVIPASLNEVEQKALIRWTKE